MPVKYRTKIYLAHRYYHIYNKGLDGRDVFLDDQDFQFLLTLLKKYLLPVSTTEDLRFKKKPSEKKKEEALNLSTTIYIVAYCLLPNHFHLLVHQWEADAITQLMRRVMTGYVMYFNKKYHRSGPLFETNYRAVMVEDETVVLHLTRFIHLNPVSRTVRRFGPVETISASRPEDYLYSSYSQYIGTNEDKWVQSVYINHTPDSYQKWVNDGSVTSSELLGELKID